MFHEVAYPCKLNGLISLDPISHGNDGLFYYRTALSMEISPYTIGIFRQTNFDKKISD